LKILAVLQKHNAVATFFCLGANLRENPEIAKQVVKAGNAIGNLHGITFITMSRKKQHPMK